MKTTIDERGRTVLTADDGMAIHLKGGETPSGVVAMTLRPGESPYDYEDCELGESPHVERYSVRAVIGELRASGAWQTVRQMLVASDYLDMFLASNYLSSVDQDFRSACAALVEHGVMTRAELDAMLARCLWSPE